jgi:hypothetical protein
MKRPKNKKGSLKIEYSFSEKESKLALDKAFDVLFNEVINRRKNGNIQRK